MDDQQQAIRKPHRWARNKHHPEYEFWGLNIYLNLNKKHIDASVKERPQTLLVPSEEICKRVLCNT